MKKHHLTHEEESEGGKDSHRKKPSRSEKKMSSKMPEKMDIKTKTAHHGLHKAKKSRSK
jgi:hypothetical protein